MDTLGAKMSSVKAADVQLFKNKCIEIKGGNVKSQNCQLREAKLGVGLGGIYFTCFELWII